MKTNFDIIVIDLPRHMLAAHKRPLMTAHEIVLVSDLTLAGIRDTLRIKSALTSLGCNARLTIVASRTNHSGEGHIDRAVFEKGIQGKIDVTIAEDALAFAAASNSGKALGSSAPKAAVTKSLRELAQRLANIDTAAVASKKPSFWSNLTQAAEKTKSKGKGPTQKRGT